MLSLYVGRVGSNGFVGQMDRGSNQVIFKRVNRVAGQIPLGWLVFFKQVFFFQLQK